MSEASIFALRQRVNDEHMKHISLKGEIHDSDKSLDDKRRMLHDEHVRHCRELAKLYDLIEELGQCGERQ